MFSPFSFFKNPNLAINTGIKLNGGNNNKGNKRYGLSKEPPNLSTLISN